MKITNRYGIPDQVVRLHRRFGEAHTPMTLGRASVTQLIAPPQQQYLKRVFDDELTEDVSDSLFAMMGSAMHAAAALSAHEHDHPEHALIAEFDGWTVTGTADLYEPRERRITDWKMTSVWSFLLGGKDEWEQQLNLYAWLHEQNGHEVESLRVFGFLRDWQGRRAKYERDYPPIPFIEMDVPLWSWGERESFLRERIALHERAFHNDVEPCTDHERWAKRTWAVMKQGQKRAVAVRDDRDSAAALAEGKKNLYVQPRNNGFPRCESYCVVRDWCQQFANDHFEEEGVTVE